MSKTGFSLLFLLSMTLVSIEATQERAPHGLVHESPVAFPPSAYNFFHPNARRPETRDACSASKCSPLPEAAQVEAAQIYESKALTSQEGRKQLGAGGIAGIVFGVAVAVLLAMGVYYVKAKRQANMSRAYAVQPQA
ncbi:uncharacterized protein LOC129314962 [Prosopis cineraria]|uniref:uncharacterized protein LOC129314962 n=1 Tax=Prosopis cineraria TaxID=364024 RepID=UPI0024101A95|nr:uncharacterized protein LOC129314962 [Prosopis cineraria]